MLPAATPSLDLDPWVWLVTIGIAVAVLVFDVIWIARNPHRPSNKETGIALGIYIGAAILFGLGMWFFAGGQLAGEFFAGWLTEYSLSVDNLFIFLLIMAKFAVPEKLQQFALMIGIIIAIVLRGLFIWLGAAAINNFSWVFYIFGAFLIYTAVKLAREGESDDEEYEENRFMKAVERFFPATQAYHGTKMFIIENGKRLATPLFFVIVALGTTDLLFAWTPSRRSTA
jgi:tellurite resistance protein TerC